MKLVNPRYEIRNFDINPELIEEAGRICYLSEPKGDPISFIRMLIRKGHLSVLEHSSVTVRFEADRGFSHELVRHRLASYSQVSTRYCDFGDQEIEFIIPPWTGLKPEVIDESNVSRRLEEVREENLGNFFWLCAMLDAETYYKYLRNAKSHHDSPQFEGSGETEDWLPQEARTVLPNSLKTIIYMTTNAREWMHVFDLRTSPAAHPQMRELLIPLAKEMRQRIEGVFDSIVSEIERREALHAG